MEKQKLLITLKSFSYVTPFEAYDDPIMKQESESFQTTLSYATAYPPLARWGDVENAVQEEFRNILTAYIANLF